jgi:carbon monoxide dehydrogenase subunit G
MSRYKASVDTDLPPEQAFDYLSDFSNAQQWDPGVVEAERLGAGEIGEGTEFRLVAVFLGRRSTLIYRTLEYERPSAVTFRAESATVVSLDRITFEPTAGGTRITYDADLALKGPWRLADPLLGLAFKGVGDRALAGMRARIGSGRSSE